MATKGSFLRHLHLPVLVFVGVGAAVLGLIYGFPVGLLVLGYYYIGLHVSQLADPRSSDQAGARYPIEATGRELRKLMSWVKSNDDYTEGTAAR